MQTKITLAILSLCFAVQLSCGELLYPWQTNFILANSPKNVTNGPVQLMLLSPNYKYTFNLTDESQVWYPGKSHTVVHAVPYKLGTFSMMRVKFDTEEEIEQIHLDKVHITSAYAVGSSERSFCPQPHPRALEKGKWYALYDVC